MSKVVAKTVSVQNSAGTATTDITFDGTKLVNTALDNAIAVKANTYDLGVGQTWQAAELTNTGATFTDGSSKFRAVGVTYTNTTGKPIMVNVNIVNAGIGRLLELSVNGLVCSASQASDSNDRIWVSAIVPNNTTYRTDFIFSSGGDVRAWSELR